MVVEESTAPRKRSHPLWRAVKIIAGLSFLGFGFIGLFLPILQGVLFMLVGLAILGTESRRVRRLLEEVKRRHPAPWRQAKAFKRRLSGWVGAFLGRGKETPSDEGASGPAA